MLSIFILFCKIYIHYLFFIKYQKLKPILKLTRNWFVKMPLYYWDYPIQSKIKQAWQLK